MFVKKHGDGEKIREIKRIKEFSCKHCGCVFDANPSEYSWIAGLYQCSCLTVANQYTSKQKRKKNH